MAAVTEDLLVRASMRDELTRPLNRVEQQAERTARSVRRLDGTAVRGGRSLSTMASRSSVLSTQLGKAHKSILNVAQGITGALSRAATVGGTVLAAAGAAAIGFGLKAAASFEQYRFAFGTLVGDVAEGNRIFDELRELNKSSPFELPQLAEATKQLLNYGFAGADVLNMTKAIADAGAAAGDPEALGSIARALGQIRSAGVARAQDLNQLVQAGIPAYELLAQSIGKTVQETRKLMESGSIDAAPFLSAFQNLEGPLENRRGASAKFAETLLGRLSTLKDTVNEQLGAALGPAVESLTAIIVPLSDVVGKLLAAVGPPLSSIVTIVAEGLVRLIPILEPLLKATADVVAELAGQLGDALLPVLPDLVDAGIDFLEALTPLLPTLVELAVLLVPITVAALEMAGALTRALKPILEPIVRLFDRFTGEAGPLDEVMGALLITLIGYRALSSIVGTLYAFAGGIRAIAAAESASAAGGAAGAAGGVAGAASGTGGVLGLLSRLGPAAAMLGRGAASAGGAVLGGGAATVGALFTTAYAYDRLAPEGGAATKPGELENARRQGLLLSPAEQERVDRQLAAAGGPVGAQAPGARSSSSGGITVNGPLVHVAHADASFDADAAARKAQAAAERRKRERR